MNQWSKAALIQADVTRKMVGDTAWWRQVKDAQARLDNNQQPIDFVTAAIDEAIELHHSVVRFKWWGAERNSPPPVDLVNAAVELVDILHFWMSDALADAFNDRDRGDDLLVLEPDDIAARVGVWMGDAITREYNREVAVTPHYFMPNTLDYRRASSNLLSTLAAFGFVSAFSMPFARMMRLCHVTPELLISMYFSKMELNKFRTEKFAVGTYSKVWSSGREDNHHLIEWSVKRTADTGVPPTPEEVYAFLEANYLA